MAPNSQRDYYLQLFSADTDDTNPYNTNHPDDEFDIPDFTQHDSEGKGAETIEISNMENLLDNLFNQFEDSEVHSNSDLQISNTVEEEIGYNPSIVHSLDRSLPDSYSESSSVSSDSTLEFIPEQEMIRLLRDDSAEVVAKRSAEYMKNTSVKSSISNAISQEEIHEDKIGTYNIQNQYDHNLAAKLFLEGDFTFLSLQEPFASRTSVSDTWGAFRRLELSSARISCFETQHQVVLFDNWRWGGKIIDPFKSLLNGRIASIAFGFEKEQCLGIISVYGFARGSIANSEDCQKDDLRKSLLYAVKKIHKKWRSKFPKIQVMIVGDMQETFSTSNFDNLGGCRYSNNADHSIIENFQDTHTSVVRDNIRMGDQYLTRFGSEGARGIDHLLFPISSSRYLIKDAAIDGTLGSLYFPSDHRLLQCTYIRNGPNNAEISESTIQYAFRDVFKIKVKRSCNSDNVLVFDDTQFKKSKQYEKHLELYQKIQDFTGDDAPCTNSFLLPIEKSIKSLYNSLWNKGVSQGVNGKQNKLVEISDRQAAELAALINSFDSGIKESMDFLQMSGTRDRLSDMAAKRINIRKKSTFKIFQNIPLPTKLRYLRSWIKEKHRRIKRHLLSIKECELKEKLQVSGFNTSDVLWKWDKTVDAKTLCSSAKTIFELWSEEAEERENHIAAVHSKGAPDKPVADTLRSLIHSRDGNTFSHLSDKTTKLINSWLQESGCSQHFDMKAKKSAFAFLKEDMGNWSLPLSDFDTKSMNWSDKSEIVKLKGLLHAASEKLAKLESKIGNAQRCYKHCTIEYFLRVNRIEDFTRKVKPKAREAPTTHTELWDTKLQAFRQCRNEQEELVATGQHHGCWMGNSSAEETCAFASLRNEGLLGIRGVNLNPDRKVTFNDIPRLIKNGDKLSTKDKKAFVEAHGPHTASLFKEPEKEHEALYYPFFLKSNLGDMENEGEISELFWKAISSTPGKARFEGFQMAVVGRFGRRWQKCLLEITKLILIMRFIPKRLKAIARFPIPKPGRINEYRPISLCHDIYCYINSISTRFSSKGIQTAKILHEGIAAYVKGKGCSLLVGVEQGVREDCLESGIPTSQTDEDEEKYFDRIPVEVLLAAMRVNGFPTQGYLELKASGMGAKTVEIITVKGTAYARFVCGLEQGNPDSPTIANLVIKFKHDIWCDVLSSIYTSESNNRDKANMDQQGKNKDAYKFHITDPADGAVSVDRIGYCDDNTRYTSSRNESDVIRATELYIKRAGDLSLVTKIGRKGSKSEVHYYNLSAECALNLKKISSFAWSFTADGPVWEKVPFKVQLQEKVLDQVYAQTKYQSLNEEEKDEFDKVFCSTAHKHLGLKSTLSGDTSSASEEVLNKVKARLKSLYLSGMQHESQKVCANMLCSTVHSYAPLQMSHKTADLLACDKLLVEYLRKRKGMSTSDAKHSIFLDKANGGYGIKSFLEVDLIANARELEIALNGAFLDSEVIRARSAAFTMRHDKPEPNVFTNYTGSAILKLADYGIHLRDSNDGIINYILSHYNQQKSFTSVGDVSYKGPNTFSIGLGKPNRRNIAYGSLFHTFLRKAFSSSGEVKENLIIPENITPKVSITTLKRLLRKYRMVRFAELAGLFNCWEWKNDWIENPAMELPSDASAWKHISISDKIKTKFPSSYWLLTPKEIRMEAHNFLNIQHSHEDICKRLEELAAPAFIATDGAHSNSVKNSSISHHSPTSSAAVLCSPILAQDEDPKEANWANKPAIPILARITKLPRTIGNHNSDIAHGEGLATCMGLEMFGTEYPKILITDSASTRDIFIALRGRDTSLGHDRRYIRKMVSGASKYICGRMDSKLHEDEEIVQNKRFQNQSNRLKQWLDICEDWTNATDFKEEQEDKNDKKWAKSYFDRHDVNPIFKIDSHQLCDNGHKIKTKARYNNLVPNLFLLSCNHLADKGASIVNDRSFTHESDLGQVMISTSNLRFFFTWNGFNIDRHISEFLHMKFQRQKIQHVVTKNTQGLPWRIMSQASMSWEKLTNLGGLFRLLKGLTRCHTRSLYKSITYRKGWILQDKDKYGSGGTRPTSQQEWINHLSPCKWCCNPNNRRGNRTHAILFCTHPLLHSYRLHMNELIEMKLANFVNLISNTQNEWETRIFLDDIESTLRRLHGLTDNNTEFNHVKYRTRKEWMTEENLDNWKEVLGSNIAIYSMIFGFSPVMEDSVPEDKHLNQAHCIPFGIIPAVLDTKIREMGKKITRFNSCQESCRNIIIAYWSQWNEIKEVNLTRIIGLHRIIGNISKDYETQFRLKYQLDDNTKRKLVQPLKSNPRKLQRTSILRTRGHQTVISQGSKKRKKRVHFEFTDFPDKICSGITCRKDEHNWFQKSQKPNRIPTLTKHCSRCSRQTTALRKCIVILEDCKSSKESVSKNNLISSLDEEHNKLNFKKTKRLIAAVSNRGGQEHAIQPKERKKASKCTDAEKSTFKMISRSIHRHTNKQDSTDARISMASTTLSSTLTQVNTFLKDDLERTSALQRKLQHKKSYIQKNISKDIGINKAKITIKEKVWCSNEAERQQNISITQVANYNQLVGGDAVNFAVMNMRFMKVKDLFIGNAATSNVIRNCLSNKDWNIVSPCFGNKLALYKPHGIYILPIFTGSSGNGHWSFFVIQKEKKFCKGWILDSLGEGNTNSEIAEKVKKLFSMARRTCSWVSIRSTLQTELECGPRTICGMMTICKSIQQGIQIENAVKKAAIAETQEGEYDSMIYRKEAASYVEVNRTTKAAYDADISRMRVEKKKSGSAAVRNLTSQPKPNETIDLC